MAMVLGGPALYLLGESLFCWRMTGETNAKRVAVAALLILLVPLGGQLSALVAQPHRRVAAPRAGGLGASSAAPRGSRPRRVTLARRSPRRA